MNWNRVLYVGVWVAFLVLVVGYLASPPPPRPVSSNGDVGIPLDLIYQVLTMLIGGSAVTVIRPLVQYFLPWFKSKADGAVDQTVAVPLPNPDPKNDVFSFSAGVVAFAKNLKDTSNIEHLVFSLLAVLRDLVATKYPTVATKLTDLAVEVQQQFFKPESTK